MIIIDALDLPGVRYPAGRVTRPLIGGNSVVQGLHFNQGYVVLDPDGGQVPWHSHEPEESYFILSGTGELCQGTECVEVHAGQLAYVPPGTYHQLTNTGKEPLVMLYCCGQGEVLHGRQELDGTLPRAGIDVPPLPPGARLQSI
ncbi:MAG: cupin [Spirochaetes bacterium RIFOXYC1_FULL_54_7]|nr:MAG: cupin [Spirochaetes bacterium RIFOXYC1_FULL_54_7]